MARNGSGVMSIPHPDFVSGTTIVSSQVDANNADIVTELTNSIAADGQTTITANIPFNSKKITGLAAGSAATDSAHFGQVQAEAYIWCGTAGGTKNALTLSPTPAITAYAAGQRFRFKSGATQSDDVVTFAVSGLTTKAGQMNGSAMSATVYMEASKWYEAYYTADGVFEISKLGVFASIFAQTLMAAASAAAIATSLGLGTGDSPQFAAVNIGHASDTTIARLSAGVIQVEGNTVAMLSAVQTFTVAQRGAYSTFTDGATITLDFGYNNHKGVLGGNRTLGVPSNIVAGQSGQIDILQDATGSRTLAYAWVWNFAGGTAPTLTTAGCSFDSLYYAVNYYGTSTVTITIAAPGVVTWTAHGLQTGNRLQLTTTGALPTGLSANTTYWVIKVDADTFSLATTLANAAAGTKITTTGSQSGVHTAVACQITIGTMKGIA